MIAVVTGGTGFIGQNLVRRLHADGFEVRCLVRDASGPLPAYVERFMVDLADPASVAGTPALDRADVVFHLAGATKAVDAEDFVAANVTGARTLLGAITARRLHPRFVYVSSLAAAGPARDVKHPVEEDDPPRPIEAYGRSKLQAERVVSGFADHVPVTVVRPCAVLGPFDRDFQALFRLAERGLLVYPGVREHWLSLLHVDDVVDGLLRAATSPRAICRTYFLASDEPVQWRALGEWLASAVGGQVRHVDLPQPLVQAAALAGELLGRLTGHVTLANRHKAALSRERCWTCSAARAREELGFRQSRSLPDAVRDTYYWYRTHGWLPGSRRASQPVA
jgi:nucleoside-diphosphate-sugar epimerase